MNLLSLVDWRAVDQVERFPDGNVTAPKVLDTLSRLEALGVEPLHGVSDYDLRDDPLIEEGISEGILWVGPKPDREPMGAAPPESERPVTWREVIPLNDGRALSIPGEKLHQQSLSFWRPGHAFDPRAAVISLLVGSGRITGLAWSRRKQCTETPNADGDCEGGGEGCVCVLWNGLEDNTTEIQFCECGS